MLGTMPVAEPSGPLPCCSYDGGHSSVHEVLHGDVLCFDNPCFLQCPGVISMPRS